MNPPMPTGAAPGGAPPAAPAGEEDPFAMFRKQIAGLDGPGKKQALQAFEDSMFKIMQDNLADVYAEVDGGDQQQPGAPPMTTEAKPPPAEMSAPVIEDDYPIDPPGSEEDFQQPPENSEMSDAEKQSRGRVMFDEDGGVAEAADGYIDEDDADLPYGASALPKGSMTGKPVPTEEEYGGKTDSWVTAMYRWEKDNGASDLEYGTPEYDKFVADYERKRMRGNGRVAPPANDAEDMPPPRMTMMGRY